MAISLAENPINGGKPAKDTAENKIIIFIAEFDFIEDMWFIFLILFLLHKRTIDKVRIQYTKKYMIILLILELLNRAIQDLCVIDE